MTSPAKPDLLVNLIGANRAFLQASIAESKDAHLPSDTDVDEYINMLASYPRSVRRTMTGANAALVNVCRALKAAQDGGS
ncbi:MULTISPECIES: hypothetical protein [unclassified Thalassospira]|uniref:hypothetical protein n=1 Tax=unclassified Thalassospira TaxID=2648997 RepID=UPI0007A5ED54|nr:MULTISPECIES: hypothetical protein [unclassified Thalassospira]KZC99720.1 hypothetical protein AUQ41_08570 [Thalassospira sp. MCCC 1A02898]ONH85350.1 hypothetical protein TH47_05765 [Thalassospira sp. MCCC 1A02803]